METNRDIFHDAVDIEKESAFAMHLLDSEESVLLIDQKLASPLTQTKSEIAGFQCPPIFHHTLEPPRSLVPQVIVFCSHGGRQHSGGARSALGRLLRRLLGALHIALSDLSPLGGGSSATGGFGRLEGLGL